MGYYRKKKEHAFKEFQNDLKNGELSGLVVLMGVEEYLIDWAKNTLINKYVNDATRMLDLDVIDSDNYDLDDLIASCETVPIMSEKKVVILRDYNKPNINGICNYCSDIPESTLLVLIIKKPDKINKKLQEVARIYDFEPLENENLVAFIIKKFKERNKSIGKSYITTLINESGYSNKDIDYHLCHLFGDIEKICNLADGDEISLEDIRLGLSDNLEHGVFGLIDTISNGRKDLALDLLNQILTSGEDEIKLLAMIISQLEIMLQTKELLDDGMNISAVAKKIKVHEFRVKKAANFVKRYSVKTLKENLKAAYNTDIQIKRGILDKRLALEILIAKI